MHNLCRWETIQAGMSKSLRTAIYQCTSTLRKALVSFRTAAKLNTKTGNLLRHYITRIQQSNLVKVEHKIMNLCATVLSVLFRNISIHRSKCVGHILFKAFFIDWNKHLFLQQTYPYLSTSSEHLIHFFSSPTVLQHISLNANPVSIFMFYKCHSISNRLVPGSLHSFHVQILLLFLSLPFTFLFLC